MCLHVRVTACAMRVRGRPAQGRHALALGIPSPSPLLTSLSLLLLTPSYLPTSFSFSWCFLTPPSSTASCARGSTARARTTHHDASSLLDDAATGEEALARISTTFETSTVEKTIKAQLAILAVAYLSTINTLRKGGPQYAPMLEPQ